MESDNCVSIPIIVLKDCNVLGRAAPSGRPNENRSHSAPNRSTPSLIRGVNTRRISESISSKSLTCFPPRSTSPSPTYVPSAENSPVSGQKPLLSWENPVLTKKMSVANVKMSDRSTDMFIRSSASGLPAKRRNSFGDIFHHHRFRAQPFDAMQRSQLGRRNHVAAPDKRRRFSFDCNRPQLMKRECHIITAAGIVKDIRGLIRSAGSAAAVGRSQRHNALIIRVDKFPVRLGRQRTSAPPNSAGSKQSGELLANLSLLA